MHKHQPRKRFGQNFLTDRTVIQLITNVINSQPQQHIIEIGPGKGAITADIIKLSNTYDAIELDRDLITLLDSKFGHYPHFKLHNADALKFNFSELSNQETPFTIIGNLPYNISTPLIFHLLKHRKYIKEMFFMLQNEVVDRMAAPPGNRVYGRLSIMLQYSCEVQKLFLVNSESFSPQPKVMSAFIHIKPLQTQPYVADNEKLFSDIVNQAFTKRRKTIKNALDNFLGHEDLYNLNIDASLRPEVLSIHDYINISNYVHSRDINLNHCD